MRLVCGADHAGAALKGAISARLRAEGHEVTEVGASSSDPVDYPDPAAEAAAAVSRGGADRAILVCGTGIGMGMVANRFPGVRAAVAHDRLTAEMCRRHNDANVLCLGARVLDAALAQELVGLFLATPFEGGRHERRVAKIAALDEGRPGPADTRR